MKRSTKRTIIGAAIFLGFLALLNPGYSSVHVYGPNGTIKTEKFSFGPGSLFVYTRVVADDSEVLVEQH
jgi:hypothetical protein